MKKLTKMILRGLFHGTKQNHIVQNILVSRQAVEKLSSEPHALIQDVVNFVNEMRNTGRYELGELPASAVQAYYMDYYLAQVNNGGHSQFIHNSGASADVWEQIDLGLAAIGATGHHAIFEDMLAWVSANSKEASEQSGFTGGRSEALDDLDTKFYALEKTDDLTQRSAKFLCDTKVLVQFTSDKLPAVRHRLIAKNPNREPRLRKARLDHIRHCIADERALGFSLAAQKMSEPAPILGISAGSHFKVEGTMKLAFGLITPGDKLFGVLDEAGAFIYGDSQVEKPKIDFDDTADLLAAMEDGRLEAQKADPEVGPRLAHLPMEKIQEAKAQCQSLQAAEKVDLLMRKMKEDPGFEGVIVSDIAYPQDSKDLHIYLHVITTAKIYGAIVTDHTSILMEKGKHISVVQKAEVLRNLKALEG